MEKSYKRAVTITEENNKLSFKLSGEITVEDLIIMCNTVILGAMKQTVENYSKVLQASVIGPVQDKALTDKLRELKEMLYDFYNVNASVLLSNFAPELELRPDLTEQAILKAENELIEQKYEELKKDNKIIPMKTPPKPKKLPVSPDPLAHEFEE